MLFKKSKGVVLLLPLMALSAFGQGPTPDTLLLKIQSAQGVKKAEAYYDAIFFKLRTDLPQAEFYLQQAEQFAGQENNPIIKAYAQLDRGIYYSARGVLDSAIIWLEKAKALGSTEKNAAFMIRTESSLGKVYISLGKPEKGLENLFDALKHLSTSPNLESELKVRINIVWAYLELKRYIDCISFGRASLKKVQPQFDWMLPYLYNNMAVAYGAINQIDSTRYYVEKSITIATAANDSNILANAYFILGTSYTSSGKYELAAQQFEKAKPYRVKIGNPMFLTADQYTLSDLYFKLGLFQKGVQAGLEALKIAQQNNLILKFENVYESLAKNYEGLGNYRVASHYYQLWAVAKDSVYKNATAQAIAEMQAKYESEKKEQQIVLQNTQLTQQQTKLQNTYLIIAALTIITLLVVVILILARNRFRRKQELLKKENEISLREVYIQATLQSQEQERKRFAQDLHDSMGQLISSLRMTLSPKDNNAPPEADAVLKSGKILDDMHKEIRSVAFNLMPQTLIQHGLLPALEEMASRTNQAGSIRLSVSGFELPDRLNELQEISLYRILQEWTNNTIKYSDAIRLDIQLVRHEDELIVTAEDNGNGFDSNLLEKSQGHGWKNIQSRVKAIKGQVELDTRVGRKGTTFTVRMPLTE